MVRSYEELMHLSDEAEQRAGKENGDMRIFHHNVAEAYRKQAEDYYLPLGKTEPCKEVMENMAFINREGREIERTVINGEVAVKPYFYFRNGTLHARYTVDRAIVLSDEETAYIKNRLDITPEKYARQSLFEGWFRQLERDGRTVVDGISLADEMVKAWHEEHNND